MFVRAFLEKGSSRRKPTEGEADSLSVASGGGASVGSDATETDVFEEIIDELFETRAAAKVEALRRLVHLMGSYFLQQECTARYPPPPSHHTTSRCHPFQRDHFVPSFLTVH